MLNGEINTLILINSFITMLLGVMHIFLWKTYNNTKGSLEWATGSYFFAFGHLLCGLMPFTGNFIGTTVSEFFQIIGISFYYIGLLKFFHKRIKKRVFIYSIIYILLSILFQTFFKTSTYRIFIFLMVMSIISALSIYQLIKFPSKIFRSTVFILIIVYTVFIISMLVKLSGSVSAIINDTITQNPISVFILISINLTQTLLIYGFIILQNLKIKTELQKLTAKLNIENKFRSDITSMLVYDFKNPLNTILHLPEQDNLEQNKTIIQKSAKQILNLTHNILDVYNTRYKQMIINPQNINIEDLIKDAFDDVEIFAEQKNLQVLINQTQPYKINVDYQVFRRVLVNLFANAVKYSPENEKIIISCESIDNLNIRISVKDFGVGIAQEKLKYIFDTNNHSEIKKFRFTVSTDLGLSYCKRAINAHNGKIGVNSERDNGAEFWIELPLINIQILGN